MSPLPTGTITFLFTDIEGSTRLLERGQAAYRVALARHDELIRQAVSANGGVVFRQAGDEFNVAFSSPTAAVRATLEAQTALQREPWDEIGPIRVRMGLHTGEAELRDDDEYFGEALHRCARLSDSAHGDQVVLSAVTAALVGATLPPGAWMNDLGEHRLRGLTRTERIYQLVGDGLSSKFPPLRTLTAVPNNLPMQATAFIGRERQIEAVRTLLSRSDARLVTLTGPGGTGKTRLAHQAAAELLDSFPDGVYVVALAPVTDPDLVASTIAQALDVREAAGRPIMASLADALRQKRLLLVLDNFEQVTAAAPVVAELLGAAPRVKVLVTSRSVLHLYGERELSVPPLALPDRRTAPTTAHLAQFEAVHLFVDRAQAARSDFALTDENASAVAEICQRLDGLPLAIELAAARVRALPPRAMLQRMERRLPLLTGGARDLPQRQRTLRDAIAWSYDLLDPDEQALFRRLGVFWGCTLETAETVCAGEPPRPGATSVALAPLGLDVFDGVESLVAKSLLRQQETPEGDPWYVMLETVREFALERLNESGEGDAVHRRHALAALRLAEDAEARMYGLEHEIWFRRLDREHDNLRAAIDWCADRGQAQPALRLAVALWWFWSAHGHIREGRERLAHLLDRFPMKPDNPRAEHRARALNGAGMLASIQGDHAAARACLEESLRIREARGDDVGVFNSLETLGTIAYNEGKYAAALAYLERAQPLAAQMPDSLSHGSVLNTMGNVHAELGNRALARDLYRQSAEAYSRTIAPEYHAFNGAMLSLVALALDDGDFVEAHALLDRALAGCREVSNRRFELLCLALRGGIHLAEGNHRAAHDQLTASVGMCQELGDLAGVSQVLERFVALAAAQRRHEATLHLAAAAATLHDRAGAPLMSSSRARLEGAMEPARRALSSEAADAAWEAGCALTPEQAIEAAVWLTAPDSPTPATESLAAPGAGKLGAATNGVLSQVRNTTSILTPREWEVAVLVARGLKNPEIAQALTIGEGTVNTHVHRILGKLGFGSRVEVATWVKETGLDT